MATRKSKIKSFAEACKVRNIKTALPGVSMLPLRHRKALIAHYKLVIITEALNTDPKTGELWEPNWNDSSQIKYNPYFGIKADVKRPSGFGFSGASYVYWYSFTSVGSRLCFKSSEIALYAAKQFKDLYIEYYLLINNKK